MTKHVHHRFDHSNRGGISGLGASRRPSVLRSKWTTEGVSKMRNRFTSLIVVLVAASVATYRPVLAQGPVTVAPMHVHHVHLNSVNPRAAAEYYLKPFPASTTKTTFNGYEAVKTGNVYLLFTKVNTPPQTELTGPQTSVWHFGWNTPDSRKYNEEFHAKGLEIAQMWDAADGKLVDMSSDTLPGLPTQEQILEMRAKGTMPTREGGFGYLRGPDGALIENAQSDQMKRFNHVHMYHEHPRCAMEWYVTHLGATLPQGRGAGALASSSSGAGGECKQLYPPPAGPSVAKTGCVRDPSGAGLFDDIS